VNSKPISGRKIRFPTCCKSAAILLHPAAMRSRRLDDKRSHRDTKTVARKLLSQPSSVCGCETDPCPVFQLRPTNPNEGKAEWSLDSSTEWKNHARGQGLRDLAGLGPLLARARRSRTRDLTSLALLLRAVRSFCRCRRELWTLLDSWRALE
jgi:hypothetical protein